MAQPFDAKGLRVTGPAIQVADAVAYMDGPRLGNFAVSDTVLAYFGVGSSGSRAIGFCRPRRASQSAPSGDPDVFNDFRLSPDDQRVAFVRSDAQGTDQIWVLDVRSGTPTPLTEGPIYEGSPVWLGNSRIVFSRNGGLGGVSQLAVDGSAPSKVSSRITRSGRFPTMPLATDGSFCMDSLRIRIGSTCGRFQRGAPPRGFEFPACPPISATSNCRGTDGGWPTCQVSRGTRESTCRAFREQPVRSGTKCPVAVGPQPKWGRDGNELFYVAGGNLMVVDIQRGPTCGAGAPENALCAGSDALGSAGMPHRYAVTADGQHFLISRTTKEAVPPSLTVILNWAAALKK